MHLQPLTYPPSSAVTMPQAKGMPTAHEMAVFQTMAEQAVKSNMYRGIGDVSGVMMIMLSARELGIPSMQALNGGLNIINGKVEISARMMSALIRKSGHSISVKESTENTCTVVGKRSDNGDIDEATYTLEDAKTAGLIKSGGGWQKYPKDMCYARAMSRLARKLFSDVIGIGYVEGEIRPTEAPMAMPDDMHPDPTIESDDSYAEIKNSYFEMFKPEDHSLARRYLEQVMKHYDWSEKKALNVLILDKSNTLSKFENWKSKISKAGEI